MDINIRKGIGSVENLAKDCTTLLGTGGQCSTLHFNCGTALGFAIFYHISCFSEKTIRCPCDTFLKRNIQRTKSLLNGFYCGRLQINKPSGWKIMIRSAFIAHRPDWNQEFVFVQIGQHSAGTGCNNFFASAGDQKIQKLCSRGSSQRCLTQAKFQPILMDDINRIAFCNGFKVFGNDCIHFKCVIINHITQKTKHTFFRKDELLCAMIGPDDLNRIKIVFKNGKIMFLYHGEFPLPANCCTK